MSRAVGLFLHDQRTGVIEYSHLNACESAAGVTVRDGSGNLTHDRLRTQQGEIGS